MLLRNWFPEYRTRSITLRFLVYADGDTGESPLATEAVVWYQSGGAPLPVAVYQPKGAANLAASYINIVSPGTFNAAPGTAPTFDAVKGWTFVAASSQYLKLGVIPNTKNYTILICYSNANQAAQMITGTKSTNFLTGLYVQPNSGNYVSVSFYASTANGSSAMGTSLDTGTIGLSGPSVYHNGLLKATIPQDGTDGGSRELYIGAYNDNGSPGSYWGGNIQYVAIYDSVLTAAQALAVSNAMLAKVYTSYVFATHSTPATNAANPLTITTYDGSGQATHPSVVYNAAGWNGFKYWMAMTPYPGGDDDYENPSILVSNDGDTWTVPVGLTNPVIAALTPPAYNSDPDLVFSADGVTLWMIYRTSNGVNLDTIWSISSTDGITWSAPTSLFTGGNVSWLSPAIIYDGSQYVIWAVLATDKPNSLQRRTCATPNGTWSAAAKHAIHNSPTGKELWHVEVVKNGATYQALVTFCDSGTNGTNAVLYFAQSSDGLEWMVESYQCVPLGAGSAWDNTFIYRSAGLPVAGGYDLFYSAKKSDGTWHIGRTTLTVA